MGECFILYILICILLISHIFVLVCRTLRSRYETPYGRVRKKGTGDLVSIKQRPSSRPNGSSSTKIAQNFRIYSDLVSSQVPFKQYNELPNRDNIL